MKKIFFGTLVFVFAITLSGCGEKTQPQPQSGGQEGGQSQQETSKKDNASGESDLIKNAISSGKKMECTYVRKIDEEMELTAVVQIEGKNFKSVMEVGGSKSYAAVKDGVMYTWGNAMAIPAKITESCLKESKETIPSAQNPEKIFDDAIKVACNSVDSVDISIPSDIQFKDICEMMKELSAEDNKEEDVVVEENAPVDSQPEVSAPAEN